MVRPITLSGTPRAAAILVPLFTSRLAPTAMAAAPTTRSTSSSQKGRSLGFSSSEASSASSGFFFICRTVSTMYTMKAARKVRPCQR